MKDAYQILGVARNASIDQIKRAYRKLARERHPDLDPSNPKADDDFKELTAAYEVLSDKDRRQRHDDGDIDATGAPIRKTRTTGYDANGRAQTRPKKPDPFAKFRRKKREQDAIRINGANVNYTLTLNMAEAAQGGVKYISMTNGKRLKVSIPKNTPDGQVLRLKGQGMPGMGGGGNGDALVSIAIENDPRFRIDGQDVHVEVPVPLAIAVLGGKITAPTLTGDVSVSIPENSNSGTTLRLRGKGLPGVTATTDAGDQFVTLKIMLPNKPDSELQAFVKTWAGARAPLKT